MASISSRLNLPCYRTRNKPHQKFTNNKLASYSPINISHSLNAAKVDMKATTTKSWDLSKYLPCVTDFHIENDGFIEKK